jgi:hypothetical protein
MAEKDVQPESQVTGSTTIQLVNRILRNLSQPSVSAIDTANRSQLALDHLNAAARAHFDDHGWDFLVQHNGYLRLRPAFQGLNLAVTNREMADGITRAQILPAGVTRTTTLYDNVGAYAVLNDDAKWDNMVVKIQGVSETPAPALTTISLEHAWHSDTSSTTANNLDILFPEYILGSEVHSVTGARFQQEELSLVFMDPDDTFDRIVPQPNTRQGPPEMLVVGGMGTQTIDNGNAVAPETLGTEATPGLRCFVWPIPDDDYIVNFSWTREFKALTDPGATNPVNTFPGVPENALDKIVDRATATMMLTTPTSDPQLGTANITLYRDNAQRAAAANRPDKGRRFSLKSMDRVGRRHRRADQNFGELLLDGGDTLGDSVLEHLAEPVGSDDRDQPDGDRGGGHPVQPRRGQAVRGPLPRGQNQQRDQRQSLVPIGRNEHHGGDPLRRHAEHRRSHFVPAPRRRHAHHAGHQQR